jgi:hypothetical protein
MSGPNAAVSTVFNSALGMQVQPLAGFLQLVKYALEWYLLAV